MRNSQLKKLEDFFYEALKPESSKVYQEYTAIIDLMKGWSMTFQELREEEKKKIEELSPDDSGIIGIQTTIERIDHLELKENELVSLNLKLGKEYINSLYKLKEIIKKETEKKKKNRKLRKPLYYLDL